ncbi:hypothetical protein EG328_006180 [Venturia inaequalis]|uniref:Rhodopsin domain-containing protein n=1 Tax=Venturia inaequalis TaxID=5025 RepID=A0A8H3Z7H2_VENIN|nr:hypothetical protein EG328_006180 [Venturia inaequalis]KAE9988359.1 hypothetical protein EG327_003388 [Venturia inaequalis]
MPSNPTASQLLTESIIFWSLGLALFGCRLWSRAILKKSWKRLQADDYMMVVTFIFYTTLLVLLQLSGRYATNQIQPSQLASILADPQQIANRIIGSKIVVASNQCYLLTLWGVKACLLTLYYNMTLDTPHHLLVKITIAYCALSLLAIELTYSLALCHPFSQYWAVPVKNPQCATYTHYCIIQMVFNITSDMLMLCIPLPFIIHSNLPLFKRTMLIAVFSLGLFVVLAAVLNKYFNFAAPRVTVYMIWDIRETGTSVMVANVMCLWPLVRKVTGWSAFLRRSSGGSAEVLTPEEAGTGFGLKGLASCGEGSGGYGDLEGGGRGRCGAI